MSIIKIASFGYEIFVVTTPRFCESCVNRVATLDSCPVCRVNIIMPIFIQVYRRSLNTNTYWVDH